MGIVFENIGSKKTLGQEIFRKIEQAIFDRQLEPGQKLPTEKELCEMFGVSRTAVREAVQMLSAKGLVNIRKGSGIYVNDFASIDASQNLGLYLRLNFDKDYALHLVHVRQMLEPQIVRIAALNHSKDDLALLTKNLEEFKDNSISSSRHAQLDLEFHLAIAESCRNPIIHVIVDPLFSLMPRVKELIVGKIRHNDINQAYEHHQRILDRIRARDADGAEQAMIKHLNAAEQDTLQLLKILEKEAS